MDRNDAFLVQAVVCITGAILAISLTDIRWSIGFTLIAFAGMIMIRRSEFRYHGRFGGWPNNVTLIRLLIMVAAVWWMPSAPQYLTLSLLIVALIADGLDGYLARRFSMQSEFGGDFDMEVDASFALLLSLWWYLDTDVGWIVLCGGFARYGFVILFRLSRLNGTSTPDMPWAKIMAVTYFIILLLPFIAPAIVSIPMLKLGSFLIIGSFLGEYYLRLEQVGK